jgi:hypothetical protein
VTAPYFASFNIDSSTDREFFMLDWSAPALLAAASGLGQAGGAHVRLGGTGNNALYYDVGDAPRCTPGSSRPTLCARRSPTAAGRRRRTAPLPRPSRASRTPRAFRS